MRKMIKAEKKASERKPPRRARRKAVPMKALTSLDDLNVDMCMNFLRYNTRLLAFAKNARFSNISTASQHTHTHKKKQKNKKNQRNQSRDPYEIDRDKRLIKG